jgi:microsomal dipeptidase-like Zn-dependent dipeptidase
LIKEGFTDEDIIKLIGGNFLRVLEKAENVARQLQQTQ